MTRIPCALSYLVQSLREFVPQVDLVGIQPQGGCLGYPVSNESGRSVDQVYEGLKQDGVCMGFFVVLKNAYENYSIKCIVVCEEGVFPDESNLLSDNMSLREGVLPDEAISSCKWSVFD